MKDALRGDDCTELRVECRGALETVMSDEYRENKARWMLYPASGG